MARLPFLDRENELARLKNAFADPGGALVVIYGRRRCGKSRLLHEALDAERDVYFVADLRDAAVQRESLAAEIARKIRGFDSVRYPDWSSLLAAWAERAPEGSVLVVDEFPYLAQVSPELPTVLQRTWDRSAARPLRLTLCGSSQRMMHGLVLDRTAPLYGRAREILKVEPLSPRWLPVALRVSGVEAVEAYSVWGGLPRNWELAAGYAGLGEAIRALVLDKRGVLHSEPPRLLLDDMRSGVQASSILSLIGSGVHRIGEIAARLQKPATALARPVAGLVDLGHVRREVPFGESPRSSKRSLYRLADPFLAFWYRFVQPNESLLELDLVDAVHERVRQGFALFAGEIWEDLARISVPRLRAGGVDWGPALRWWGTDLDGRSVEIDVAAESLDGKSILVGEAEWTGRPQARLLASELAEKSRRLPFVRGRPVHLALWLKAASQKSPSPEGVSVVGPAATLEACG